MSDNFIKQLNTAAKKHFDPDVRKQLRLYALMIDGAAAKICKDQTLEAVQELVGVWTRASLFLDNIPPNPDPNDHGGTMPVKKVVAA